MYCKRYLYGFGIIARRWIRSKYGSLVHADNKNLSLDRLRSLQRKGTYPIAEGFDIKQTDATPDVKIELGESMLNVNQLIASLPEKQRQVIHLRDVEGYTYNEICEILELDMNQVKVSLFRARNAVKEKLMKINAYGL